MVSANLERLRTLERWTRPVDPEVRTALDRRWAELPAQVKTRSQTVGRHSVGCEGTHGVFPRCNLACTPCYHSEDANKVRIDGTHTLVEVDRQMAYLRSRRGPRAHAQLIGGEVTLLTPEVHAEALKLMRRHGRLPMSMTHGDFDYDYLEQLALAPDGMPRFGLLSFAGHFDSLMIGRRGIKRPRSERDLHPYRQRFCEMFQRLQREHGVRHYLAHNMTVTPQNLGEVAEVIRSCRRMGFRMFSFQPAAYVGDERRWREGYRAVTSDSVWAEIERGAGARLPYKAIQVGDERCNRTVWGLLVGERWVPVVDDLVAADLEVRDRLFTAFAGMDFGAPRALLTIRLARAAARQPGVVPLASRWAVRLLRRVGLRNLLRGRVRPLTFVMHSFMDAADVKPAWELLRRGELSDDPRIRATQERLQACSYAMAHPESDELVPACAQHSALDPLENIELRRRLPLVGGSAR
ncbi:MAG: radical SAM domain-containing protein [Actinobacteria bacterium]|nr:radical SAM domain-containing protein [Actinomycetota bacterium]